MQINPNSDIAYVNSYSNLEIKDKVKRYAKYFDAIKIISFRHLSNIELKFHNPITVISGNNKSGKTSILLAIACSHYFFMRRSMVDGKFQRNSWKNVIRFSTKDEQTVNWQYEVSYRNGDDIKSNKSGYRKFDTGKWGGVAKKEGQIGSPKQAGDKSGRHVIFIDLDRMLPARSFSSTIYKKITSCEPSKLDELKEYLSYIFEKNISISDLINIRGNEMFLYEERYKYTSFNSASGEDVISRMLMDILWAPRNSLVLIDEIEESLHPKVQRKLMEILFHISRENQIQFIITSHSATILQSVNPQSRVFIDNNNGVVNTIPNISVSTALSKMDSLSYPILNIYVEDDISKKIVDRAILELSSNNSSIIKTIRVIDIGTGNQTYNYFKINQKLYDAEKVNAGVACILDGDMKNEKNSEGSLLYPPEDFLHFLYSNDAPEKFLVQSYLNMHNNDIISYHLQHSNVHCLFDKMAAEIPFLSRDDAFLACLECFCKSNEGAEYFNELKDFITKSIEHYSVVS